MVLFTIHISLKYKFHIPAVSYAKILQIYLPACVAWQAYLLHNNIN